MQSDSRRLSILSAGEIDDLYQLPQFTENDRHLYFDLSAEECKAVQSIHTFSVSVYLILQLGYFKAKRQFFVFEQDTTVLEDLRFIMNQHFPNKEFTALKAPSRPTRTEQQRTILQLLNYRLCDGDAKVDLKSKAQRVAMLSTQPIYIFRELTQHLAQQRIVAPSYRYMQEMIGQVVTNERARVSHLLSKSMTSTVDNQLIELLHAGSGTFRISAIKHEAKDFSYKELRCEVARRQFFQPLHEFAQNFLTTAGISNESGKYYASLVKFYTTYKLQRMAIGTARLYLLCFVYHRFRQINDNLIEAFIH